MYRRKYQGSPWVSPSEPEQPRKSGLTRRPASKSKGTDMPVRAAAAASRVAAEEHAHPSITKGVAAKEVAQGAGVAHQPKDLMISYSHADKEMMIRVREKLEQSGITVWVDVSGLEAGVDFLSKIGEAIIDAKLFISLLSPACVKSRYCQDELALAYVSDTAIFPVAIVDPEGFKQDMDTGMKLQLARYEWTVIKEAQFDEQIDDLIEKLKDELMRRRKAQEDSAAGKKPTIQRAKSRTHLNKRQTLSQPSIAKKIMPDEFWEEHFKTEDTADANKFEDILFNLFKDELAVYFRATDLAWLKSILRREMEVEDDTLQKYNFDEFCRIDGESQPVWDRVLGQAMESYAMKDVFNMESSVRVEAIENLGKFRSAAVIDALRDLLTDNDANCRAVAAVSLARTEANDAVTLKHLSKTLADKDRLVREAGCLALGHLKAKQVVARLLHLWRNDVISHVREAARVALEQIGGPEVERAMHVTKVLADEIRQLTAQ